MQTIAVIGSGPAGLKAAETLSEAGFSVIVYDQMPSPARKFLMAGRSGLNLTHTEDLERFISRYGAAAEWLEPFIRRFPPEALRKWAEGLGQPCFTGSSGRVFPRVMKASPLLRAWLTRLSAQGVRFAFRHRWTGWTKGDALRFETREGVRDVLPTAVILAMGGASWPRLGSGGGWITSFAPEMVSPLLPANCGFITALPDTFHARFHGAVLNGVLIRGAGQSARGDVMITRQGLEGAPIYRVSAGWRDALERHGQLTIEIDLRPGLTVDALAGRLAGLRERESFSNRLRRLGLSAAARWLLQENLRQGPAIRSLDANVLAQLIKSCRVRLIGPDTLAKAISTAGGVRQAALDDALMLRARPGVFVAGEMLDWEAPTGGYLLQACFATGRAAALGAQSWLAGRGHPERSG